MSPVRLLAPPYRQLAWITDGLPPLGSVALAPASSAEIVSGVVKPLVKRAPWCVPCLVTTTETAAPAVLEAIHGLPGQPAFLSGPVADPDLPAAVVAAVGARPLPGGNRLADFVVRRTGRPDLRVELASLLSGEAGEVILSVPERTLRDRLRRFGPLGTHCWRAIGALCRTAARGEAGSVERIAMRAGVGPRTLRGWVRRYLAVPMAEFRGRLGWEWVMESALRIGGYVERPDWTRPYALRPPRAVGVLPSLLPARPRPRRREAEALVTEIRPVELSEVKAPTP